MKFSELKVCGYVRKDKSVLTTWTGPVERWAVSGDLPDFFEVFDKEERRKYDDKVTVTPCNGPSEGRFIVFAFKEEGHTP